MEALSPNIQGDIIQGGARTGQKVDYVGIVLAVAILVSQLAICNHVVISYYCSQFLHAAWAIVAGVIIFAYKKVKFNRTAWALVAALLFTLLQNKFFHSIGYYRTGGLGVARTLFLCVLFYEVGLNVNKSPGTLKIVLGSYIFGSFLLMFLRKSSGIALNSVDKNALGAITGAGLLAILFYLRREFINSWQKIMLYLFFIYIAGTLVSMHTRAPVVAFVSALGGLYALKHKLKKSILTGIILLILATYLIPFLLESQSVRDYLQGVKSSSELTFNSMSSMRMVYWIQAWEEIKAHPWIGQGGWAYVDCFPLFVLRQGGLLSAFLLFSVTYGKFYRILCKVRAYWMNSGRMNSPNASVLDICSVLVLYYSGLSLFEGYVPFGPATSILLLWLVLGMAEDSAMCHQPVMTSCPRN